MARNQKPRRSDDEWFNLITECRNSGMSDSHWCKIQGISSSTFFCAVKRLRTKAYALPEHAPAFDTIPYNPPKQDIVKVDIEPDPLTIKGPETLQPVAASYLDNSHTIEIDVHGIGIRVSNGADPALLRIVLTTLGGGLC